MRIKNVIPCYTGGGIYIFVGALTDGNFFLADTGNYDVRILDTEIELDNEDHFQSDFQESHLVRDLDEPECFRFIMDALRWVKKHNPKGNYLQYDIDNYITEMRHILNTY